MKITLTFLLLGISFALTNAFFINKNNKKEKKMSEMQAFSHGRMTTLVLKRFNVWQNCQRCTEVERNCLETAIVEDLVFILKLLADDMGQTVKDLVIQTDFKIDIQFVFNAVDSGNCASLTQVLRSHGLINHFLQTIIACMNKPLQESNVNLGSICSVVNDVMGGAIGPVLGIVTGAIGGVVDLAGGVLGTATGLLGTATGAVGNVIGSATGLLGGLKLG